MKQIDISKYATVAGAAKLVNLNTSTLWGAIRAGRVVQHALDCGSPVVEVADVKDYMKSRPKRGRGSDPVKQRSPNKDVGQFSTVAGAAEKIGMHRSSLWNLVSTGAIPSYKLACGAELVLVSDVESYRSPEAPEEPVQTQQLLMKLNIRTRKQDFVGVVANAEFEKIRPYREVNGELQRCTIDVVADGDELKLIIKD